MNLEWAHTSCFRPDKQGRKVMINLKKKNARKIDNQKHRINLLKRSLKKIIRDQGESVGAVT